MKKGNFWYEAVVTAIRFSPYRQTKRNTRVNISMRFLNFFTNGIFQIFPEFCKNSVFITLDTEHLMTTPNVIRNIPPSHHVLDSFENGRVGKDFNRDHKMDPNQRLALSR